MRASYSLFIELKHKCYLHKSIFCTKIFILSNVSLQFYRLDIIARTALFVSGAQIARESLRFKKQRAREPALILLVRNHRFANASSQFARMNFRKKKIANIYARVAILLENILASTVRSVNRAYDFGRESFPRIGDKSREIPTIPLAAWPIPALYGLAVASPIVVSPARSFFSVSSWRSMKIAQRTWNIAWPTR